MSLAAAAALQALADLEEARADVVLDVEQWQADALTLAVVRIERAVRELIAEAERKGAA